MRLLSIKFSTEESFTTIFRAYPSYRKGNISESESWIHDFTDDFNFFIIKK